MLAYLYTLKLLVSKPLADSGASVKPRNQIKNERENSWRTKFPDNHSLRFKHIQTRFQTCMAPGLSHGCAGLLVFLCVFLHAVPLHDPYKPEASRNGESSWHKVLEFASRHDTAVA